jgi:hypothetical protein
MNPEQLRLIEYAIECGIGLAAVGGLGLAVKLGIEARKRRQELEGSRAGVERVRGEQRGKYADPARRKTPTDGGNQDAGIKVGPEVAQLTAQVGLAQSYTEKKIHNRGLNPAYCQPILPEEQAAYFWVVKNYGRRAARSPHLDDMMQRNPRLYDYDGDLP